MSIEWPSAPESTNMSINIPDNWPATPTGPGDVLVASIPFQVRVTIDVGTHGMTLGGSFQVRAFAESIGPGQELQLGQVNVSVVPGQTAPYTAVINVPANTLLGEGQLDSSGNPVSGVYKIVVVMQHMNPGPTYVSGFAEDTFKMFLNP